MGILEKTKVLCSLVTISTELSRTLYVYIYPYIHDTKDNTETYLRDLDSYDTELIQLF